LEEYGADIEYIQGEKNIVANTLLPPNTEIIPVQRRKHMPFESYLTGKSKKKEQ
jgi:hypothetical protein